MPNSSPAVAASGAAMRSRCRKKRQMRDLKKEDKKPEQQDLVRGFRFTAMF
jgi:hypothetical protein